MKPRRFEYVRPNDVAGATRVLGQLGASARVIAGGQSLLPLLYQGRVEATALVDVGRLTELRYVRHDHRGGLRVGALTRHVELERLGDATILAEFGVLRDAAALIGHLPIRVRGSVGGSLAHADPVSEWCLLAVGLDAVITLTASSGIREVAASDFFTGPYATVLRPDELVTEVRFERPAPTAVLTECAPQAGHFPLVAALAAVELDQDDRVGSARVAVSGLASHAIRLPEVEQALLGEPLSAALIDHSTDAIRVPDGGTAEEYHQELAVTLLGRALRESALRARTPRLDQPTEGASDES